MPLRAPPARSTGVERRTSGLVRSLWRGFASGACVSIFCVMGKLAVAADVGPFYNWANFAGVPGTPGDTDGTATVSRYNQPYGVAPDKDGNLYIADTLNCTIRKVDPSGNVITFAGQSGVQGSTDGLTNVCRFYNPTGLAFDSDGNLFVADFGNHTIRKITPAGQVSTLAGLAGTPGSANGTGADARFEQPKGIAVSSSGIIYVADHINHIIRRITQSGEVTTLAGLAGTPGSANGQGSAARFKWPTGVAVDNTGNVYVADWGNSTIRKITAAGLVSSVAGSAFGTGTNDGPGTVARFKSPWCVAVDPSGYVFITDSENNTIRKLTPNGVVSTVGSIGGTMGSADGFGSAGRFWFPTGIAADKSGALYVADTYNDRISKGSPVPVLLEYFSVMGQIQLSWSTLFLGWELQAQTNSSGVTSSNWYALPGSTNTTIYSMEMDRKPGTVSFRLYSPRAP